MSVRRTALITGANRGIGLAVATELARRAVDVILTGRDGAEATAAAARIGPEVRALPLDMTNAQDVERARDVLGQVDILVCNGGVLLDAGTDPTTVSLDLVERTFAVNLLGSWRIAQACLPGMVARGWGRVVFLSSGTTPEFGGRLFGRTPGYSLSKAALNGLTTLLAEQLQGSGVLVNAVNPGRVRTRMMPGDHPDPDDVAGAVADAALLADDGPSGQFLRAAPASANPPIPTS